MIGSAEPDQPLADSVHRTNPADRPVTTTTPQLDTEIPQTSSVWAGPRANFPDVCVHQLFEEQARRTPDRIAVIGRDRSLSYSDLNQRANHLAHLLRDRGVGPETLVGVCLERSPELVVALLGIWKAGGAYVPLDPAYPQGRIAFMVEDANVRIILTEERCRHLIGSIEGEILNVDKDVQIVRDETASNLRCMGTPSNLAYVMYTSGSTGTPKGAMIHHRGLVNYLWWAISAYDLRAGESVPVHSSISFDLTVTSLYPALLSGGCVELLPEGVGAFNLVSALRSRKRRNLVKITPAHLEILKQQLSPEEMKEASSLFVIGGENLLAESLGVWRQNAPDTRFINEYGPTETVVGCCVYEVQAEDPLEGAVPIGRPIANMQMYVLDDKHRILPPGMIGEIFIGGVGVARGYLNRPELTQERFVSDPFSSEEGARMYKTGDLGRYRKDGVVEYLGRTDNQVKVNGYRIELGEIETSIARWPLAQSCVVLAREDGLGGKQLIAYVVMHQRASGTATDLQDFLRESLPEYMIPARVVFLDALPLTHNGKIDRNALPSPPVENQLHEQKGDRPRNAIEQALTSIWVEMLKINDFGIHDDFFDLGGRSLLAIRTLSRIRDVFQIELPAETLFENSTISSLANVIAQAKLAQKAAKHIQPREYDGSIPLSFPQELFWYVQQLQPDSPVYNIVDAVVLHGSFDASAIQRSVNEVVRRHEILRTVFKDVKGIPVQDVLENLELQVREVDLTTLSPDERESAWRETLRANGQEPFDLSRAPLMRATVIRWHAHEQRLILVLHHILSDEWSMEIIHHEIKELYRAFVKNEAPQLLPLPIQYKDFALWQRDDIQGKSLKEQIDYWKQELSGAPVTLDLPADRPRPPRQSFRGDVQRFSLPYDVLVKLTLLSQQERATLFMTLEASFAALLYRYTQQNDILIGTPISCRTHSNTEDLVGCFLNSLILRTQIDEKTSFRSLLQQTRRRALAAYVHSDMPLSKLVAELAPERDPSRSPLFQVMFILHNKGVSQVANVSRSEGFTTGTSKFDLSLIISEGERGLDGMIEYSTDLFNAGTIQRMSQHYVRLLESIGNAPDEPISQLPMLGESERKLLLVDWNNTHLNRPHNLALHQLLEKQACLSPDRIAVVYENKALSYEELNHRANQVAHRLRELGVGPDILVGLLMERSLEMVVGLLGILKAGGAYVPLDPAFPQSRLAYMVEDSNMSTLITHRGLEAILTVRPPIILHLDSDWHEIAQRAMNADDLPNVSQSNRAYVLYTSGSTGKPKGVEITHAAIVNFLLSMHNAPGMHEDDVLLALTTLSFDIAGLEIYLPLLTGAKVVIASDVDIHDPRRLMNLLQQSGCTVMQATPATYRALIHAGWSGKKKLKLLCGGEALSPDLADDLLSRSGELWNMYGPTETTVWSTIQRVTSSQEPISIGKPIGNTQVYVLDAHRNLVPIGACGELYIGGDGLARGYLNREDLTSERFVPSPFASGTRLYRTGDLARWMPDGTLHCLGRVDSQVKIRGFRIELGEIEAVLSRHEGVRHAVVTVHENAPGDKRLVAYFEKKGSQSLTSSELRAHMEAELPAYMVPSAFIELDRLPLTPNGKIDRKSLPVSPDSRPDANAFVAPTDPLEQMLTRLWAKTLKVGQVGIHDNFFDLGGHSLLAVRIVIEIEKICHIRLPIATLLEAPTVAGLAAVLREKNWSPSWSSLVPIRTAGTKPPLFLMHSHGGNTLEYLPLAKLLDADQPVYALQARGLNGRIPANTSIAEMAAAYIEELKSAQPEGPYLVGGFCFGGVLALEAAQQLRSAGHEVSLLFLIQTIHPQCMHFSPNISVLQRMWYRTEKRVNLELQNLSYRGVNYFAERFQYTVNHLQSKAAFALGRVKVEERGNLSHLPTHYILEALSIKHSRAIRKYEPKTYDGNVLIFRAKKQLRGLDIDEYLGWRNTFTGTCEVIEIAGHQQNLLLPPHVVEVASKLRSHLNSPIPQAERLRG